MDGTILDGFRLTARLGRGEDGEVHRALAADGSAWALRVLSPTAAGPVDHGRLEAIHRALAALTRAGVPGVLLPRWITQGSTIALVTPLLDGEGLDALKARLGRLPWAAVREIGLSIAATLSGLHRAGIVFGGLRPSKCFVDRTGRIWLRDVGLAINTATPAGAPWMSPEQAAEAPTIDARSDQYALAAILHDLLAGEPPFVGAAAQVAMMQRFKAPRPLRKIDRSIDVPSAIEAAILRALEKDPKRRFPSVDDLAEFLADGAPNAPYVPGATLAGVLGEESTVIVQPLVDPRGSSQSGVIDDAKTGAPDGNLDVETLFAAPATDAPRVASTTSTPAPRVASTTSTPARRAASTLEPPGGSVPATIELPPGSLAIDARPAAPPPPAPSEDELLAAPRLVARPQTLTPSPEDAALPAPAGATPPPWLRERDLLDLRRESDDEGPSTLVSAPPLLGAGAASDATALLPVYAEEAREPGQTALIPGFGGARLFAADALPLAPGTGPGGPVLPDRNEGTGRSHDDEAARGRRPTANALDRTPTAGPPARTRASRRGPLARLQAIPSLLRRGWELALAPLRRLMSQRSRLLAPLRALRGQLGRITRLWSRWSS